MPVYHGPTMSLHNPTVLPEYSPNIILNHRQQPVLTNDRWPQSLEITQHVVQSSPFIYFEKNIGRIYFNLHNARAIYQITGVTPDNYLFCTLVPPGFMFYGK